MKTLVKIEIAILILVLLTAVVMCLMSSDIPDLFREPVAEQREPAAVPTEPVQDVTSPTEAPSGEEVQPMEREISARACFAYDMRTGEYLLLQGDPDETLYIASITKLLTAYTALQFLDPRQTVPVEDALELVQRDSSVAGLEPEDRPTVEQLIAALMLPSGNDAAQALAVAAGRAIAGDSTLEARSAVKVFVSQMNAQAEKLGMTNSHFENPDGFHHENHYTTMNDLVILAETVLLEPEIAGFTVSTEETVQLGDRTLTWNNTNLQLYEDSVWYLPNTMGLKTGYTDAAGNCLLSAYFMDDRILLIGVFGCPTFTDDRYQDIQAIYNSVK